MRKQVTLDLTSKKKLMHFEIMRLLAIFFVVYTHTGENGFFLFSSYSDTSFSFWAYLFLSVFSSFSVPLFFMISGALMLNRNGESLDTIWKKRVFRYAILLVTICFLYYIQRKNFDVAQISLKEFIIVLYSYCSGSITWFLYSYLAYLILLPILRVLAQNMKNTHFIYIFGIVLTYQGVIPVLEYLFFQGTQTINPYFTVGWVAEKIVVYPLLGYYLEHRLQKEKLNTRIWILWIVNILTILLSCAMTVYRGRIMGEYLENMSEYFFTTFVPINASVLYITISVAVEKKVYPKAAEKLIYSAGQCTLGIYGIHFFIMQLPWFEKVRINILNTGINDMFASMIFCLFIMACSYVITFVLRTLPYINKIL